jgi:hypothetical protein
MQQRQRLQTEPLVGAYYGHLIRFTLTGECFIEKDGQLVGWAASVEDAKRKIDELIANS